eukprot:gene5931-4242_t
MYGERNKTSKGKDISVFSPSIDKEVRRFYDSLLGVVGSSVLEPTTTTKIKKAGGGNNYYEMMAEKIRMGGKYVSVPSFKPVASTTDDQRRTEGYLTGLEISYTYTYDRATRKHYATPKEGGTSVLPTCPVRLCTPPPPSAPLSNLQGGDNHNNEEKE